MKSELYTYLEKYSQEHLLKYWDELRDAERLELEAQIQNIDFEELKRLISDYVIKKPKICIPDDLTPAPFYPRVPSDTAMQDLYDKAVKKGRSLLENSKVAAFTVAGGQGTRLGFDGPKGTFPITPVKGKSLFQYFAEKIKRASEKYKSVIPWYIMTSDMNHFDTCSFFEKHHYFGLNSGDVMFFKQGTMPAIGYDGKLILESKSSLSLSPNGHGGSLIGLKKSGALADMAKRGVESISYFQVDNPLVPITNLLFLGLHSLMGSEMSAIMIPKTGPYEKLGNFCVSNGKTLIIEYSDLPNELAEKRNPDGSLSFIAGSPAIHIISREFVEKLTSSGTLSLPWHRADKKVACIDGKGEKRVPEKENAVKLETFIFDALPLASKTVILEGEREKQFAPTKNKTGVDSVESCRQMLVERDSEWLENFGMLDIPRKEGGKPDCVVELSPVRFLDEEDVLNNKSKLYKVEKGASAYFE